MDELLAIARSRKILLSLYVQVEVTSSQGEIYLEYFPKIGKRGRKL